MKMSSASDTSANASANDRKIVLRAGTYVTGMPPPISSARSCLGTSMSAVSADPPKARRSISVTTWRFDAQRLRDARGEVELARVALAVAEGERVRLVALGARDRERRGRVKPAGQEDHRAPGRHDGKAIALVANWARARPNHIMGFIVLILSNAVQAHPTELL